MPRGKELEQLPMANIAPSAGDDRSSADREILQGIVEEEPVAPAKAKIKNENRG
ncbi:hypothetical protein BGM26_09475 [Bacillus sp. FJAT-29790]|uniref:hypothetical protein n=1 Tax=Bacillus sp. FJAT-29790 TaxID=1895002 RepID=UPI001C223F4F|nr:hypothetical protein [Bacillus sp. FJAT-29790]MBU8879213.1 hypothetical protein [Bacillus sp. FJAT-29790]